MVWLSEGEKQSDDMCSCFDTIPMRVRLRRQTRRHLTTAWSAQRIASRDDQCELELEVQQGGS